MEGIASIERLQELAPREIEEIEGAQPQGSGDSRETLSLVGGLLRLAGHAKAMELMSHLVHLNFEGREFLEVHGFLKERYEAHLAQFDVLTELVRTLDYLVPVGLNCSMSQLPYQLSDESTGAAMLLQYLRNTEAFGMGAKELVKLAREADAPDIENYGAELVADAYKTAWFLKAILR
jgi:DNA-binding ferritin-like protein